MGHVSPGAEVAPACLWQFPLVLCAGCPALPECGGGSRCEAWRWGEEHRSALVVLVGAVRGRVGVQRSGSPPAGFGLFWGRHAVCAAGLTVLGGCLSIGGLHSEGVK